VLVIQADVTNVEAIHPPAENSQTRTPLRVTGPHCTFALLNSETLSTAPPLFLCATKRARYRKYGSAKLAA
jgi:hypothetical protein